MAKEQDERIMGIKGDFEIALSVIIAVIPSFIWVDCWVNSISRQSQTVSCLTFVFVLEPVYVFPTVAVFLQRS